MGAVVIWTRDDAARFLSRMSGDTVAPSDMLVSFDSVRAAYEMAMDAHRTCCAGGPCHAGVLAARARDILLGEVRPLEQEALPLS